VPGICGFAETFRGSAVSLPMEGRDGLSLGYLSDWPSHEASVLEAAVCWDRHRGFKDYPLALAARCGQRGAAT